MLKTGEQGEQVKQERKIKTAEKSGEKEEHWNRQQKETAERGESHVWGMPHAYVYGWSGL